MMMMETAVALLMMLMMLGNVVHTAPAQRGSVKPLDLLPGRTADKSEEPASASLTTAMAESHRLTQNFKQWLLTAGTTAAATTSTSKPTGKSNNRRVPSAGGVGGPSSARPGRRAQLLKMISALEELHKTLNSTLSTRITLVPRANGKHSGRKSKMMQNTEGSVKPTTVPPVDVGGTASRASTDVIIPSSLSGRNFKKSIPPQPKKTNKRVCFWKYCSQN